MRIAYLVPEFPGQTHAFFWREIEQLERLGAAVEFVSTRRPSQGAAAPHAWASQAIARTVYLYPISLAHKLTSIWQLFKAGPVAWWRCAVVLCTSPRSALRMMGMMILGAHLAAQAQKCGWTHLHVHSCADAANIALFAHLISSLPYSLTLHGNLQTYGGNQPNKWRHARFAIVISDVSKAAVASELAGHLPPLVLKAPMGVNLESFTRRQRYEPYDGDGHLRVFCCGRLHPVKGIDVLIHAVAQAREQGLSIHLTVAGEDAGDGTYRAYLQQLIHQHALSGNVHLAGALSEEDVKNQLEMSHLFVLASRHEPLGVATMEAMAMKVPVIVTRTGGVAELVEHNVEGLLVEPESSTALAAAMIGLARDPVTCWQMSKAARLKVERGFHSGISARAIVDGIERSDRTPRVTTLLSPADQSVA